jgi:hypothetical protein
MVIDHDHATGKARGMICNSCNAALGLIGDDPETLMRLAAYLKDPPLGKFGFDWTEPTQPLASRKPKKAPVPIPTEPPDPVEVMRRLANGETIPRIVDGLYPGMWHGGKAYGVVSDWIHEIFRAETLTAERFRAARNGNHPSRIRCRPEEEDR